MSVCKSCGSAICWVETERGRPMPLDAAPTVDGNVTLEHSDVRRGNVAVVHGPLELADLPEGTQRFTPHFASCPFAGRHRRG